MDEYMRGAIHEKIDLVKDGVLKVVPGAEAIYLFGSYVNGTPHKDSDLDICVIVPDGSGDLFKLRAEIRSCLFGKIKMPLDLFMKESSVFHRRKQIATLDKVIAREGVLIYG
jgi:predicted nucleotidyltransferase